MDAGLPIHCVKGALISLAQTFRIPVLRTRNPEDTAWHFNQLFLQRDRIGSNRGARKAYRPKRLDNQKKAVLKSIPGIGDKAATALLEKFESVADVFAAKTDDLLSVHGIGRKTAAKIREIVREDHSPYIV